MYYYDYYEILRLGEYEAKEMLEERKIHARRGVLLADLVIRRPREQNLAGGGTAGCDPRNRPIAEAAAAARSGSWTMGTEAGSLMEFISISDWLYLIKQTAVWEC